jgi:hypothetical protein
MLWHTRPPTTHPWLVNALIGDMDADCVALIALRIESAARQGQRGRKGHRREDDGRQEIQAEGKMDKAKGEARQALGDAKDAAKHVRNEH